MNKARFHQQCRAISEHLDKEDFHSAHQQAIELRIKLSSESLTSPKQLSHCIYLELQALAALREWDGFVEMMDEFKTNLTDLDETSDTLIKTQMMTALAEIGRGTEIPEWGMTLCTEYLLQEEFDSFKRCVEDTRQLLEKSEHGFLISGFEQEIAQKLSQFECETVNDLMDSLLIRLKNK